MAFAKAAALFAKVRTVAPELSVTVTTSSDMLAVPRALTGNWSGNRVGAECLTLADALAVMRALVAQKPRVVLVVLMFMMVLSWRSLRFLVLSCALAEVSACSHQPIQSCRVTTNVLGAPAEVTCGQNHHAL
jgi:hypothetical protein